ncbi:hypothetical protein PQ465_13435 [Sphingobacterium oryzagri]|uniref:Uncharacterized protein n=1 Tax=Sphingobacterium oryzagri TaxID=3025669 RepID=A0ABY7WCU6_9SPHI|nr:hypothetical protein [Sphingobacterium sp. KACC 22765]WDF67307.1 hypothetical protein PQ465_13435 [Sphingobacterium sp. KACC 22765]
MKNLAYSFFIISVLWLFGCEPIENRLDIGSAISADQLQLTATPLIVDGKKSNKVILDNKSPVLSSWDYGVGITQRKTDTVLLVATGENEIVFTGLNPDGSKISKTLSVIVDELSFPVPLEWGFLTDGGEKSWVWDTQKPAVWGNGGYMGNVAPAWWTLQESAINGQAAGEGVGAKMIFSLRGATLSKVKSTGQTDVGAFSFDMTKKITLADGTVWAKGKLTTKGVTVLCGISPNEGNAPVYEYDILLINGNELVLCYPEPGVGAWGTAWFWVFRAE